MPKSPPVAFSSLESLNICIRRSPVLASWGLVPDRRAENGLIEGKHLMISGIPPLDSTGLSHSVAQGKVDQAEQSVRRRELLRASQEFESYFLSYLMKVMRETVPKGALTANRMGDMFYSFYDEEIGKRAAQAGGIGLSDYVLDTVTQNEDLTRPPISDPSSMKS
jgi:flagellar protein FlgJ